MSFWSEYGLFLAKAVTFLVTALILVGGIIALRASKSGDKNKLEIKNINDKFNEYANILRQEVFSKKSLKTILKEEKKQGKELAEKTRKKIFVLDFNGDIKASAVQTLREEITAVIQVAGAEDEVLVRLESPGGAVPHYGLAASQLQRIRQKHIPLTIAVDKVAASGGYLMSCVGNKIIAAPFAIIGSIGVVAQLPNFHRLLKKKDVDFEQITAGEWKRTLTLFGENTAEGREKMQMEINEIHEQFKSFIEENRPQVNIQAGATGEYWLANKAFELRLVDEIKTSDDYLLSASQQADIYQINYTCKKSLADKLSGLTGSLMQSFKLF